MFQMSMDYRLLRHGERNDERPFEVEGGDARRDEIVEGDHFPRGKGGGKVHVFVPSLQAGQERVHPSDPDVTSTREG